MKNTVAQSATDSARKTRHVVTIREVAAAAGLSVATVSMVLNKVGRRIPAATHRMVEQTARELGYTPNLQARSLRSRRTRSIGVATFDITDPYCSLIVRGIENTLTDAGYMPLVADTQNVPERLQKYVGMFMERRVEGLIAIANPVHLGPDFSAAVRRFNIPAVVIGSKSVHDRYASVVTDNEAGGAAAVEHLLSLGHHEIAVIRGPRRMDDSAPRWNGVTAGARRHGIPIAKALTREIRGGNSSYEEGYRIAESLLRSGRRFTALVAFDDLTAFAAIGALASSGARVPEDCSVIGFDDVPGAAYYNPPLTTIRQGLEEQGEIAAQMMLQKLSGEAGQPDKMQAIVPPRLIIRKSTSKPGAAADSPSSRKCGAEKVNGSRRLTPPAHAGNPRGVENSEVNWKG